MKGGGAAGTTDLWAWVQASAAQAVERPDGVTRIRRTHLEKGRPAVPVAPIHAVQFATGRTACGLHSPRFIWAEWPPSEPEDACSRCARIVRQESEEPRR